MAKRQKDDKRETFSLTAPAAMEVVLVGDFTHWEQKPVPRKKGADGVWQTRVELAPGEHHYRFIVDGQWWDDPECSLRVPNPYGTQDSVRQVN